MFLLLILLATAAIASGYSAFLLLFIGLVAVALVTSRYGAVVLFLFVALVTITFVAGSYATVVLFIFSLAFTARATVTGSRGCFTRSSGGKWSDETGSEDGAEKKFHDRMIKLVGYAGMRIRLEFYSQKNCAALKDDFLMPINVPQS